MGQCIEGSFQMMLHFYICINVYSIHAMKRKSRRRSNKGRRRRSSKIRIAVDRDCWGKNKPLEDLWRELSSYLSVVVIYKGDRPYEIVKLHQSQPMSAERAYAQFHTYEQHPDVIAILTAHHEAKNVYETLLYPKAKDKTVDYVIVNYGDFFKRTPTIFSGVSLKKIRVPK